MLGAGVRGDGGRGRARVEGDFSGDWRFRTYVVIDITNIPTYRYCLSTSSGKNQKLLWGAEKGS